MTLLGGLIKPAPEAAEPAPEYLDVDLALEDVDLGQLLQRLQFKLPFPVEGKLSFKVHASIPINTPRDMKNYRLTGTANLPRVNVAGVEMADVATRLTLDNGLLELQELKGRAILPAGGAGSFAGTARMRIAPLGDLSADLSVDRFPLAAVLNLLPGAGGKADGALTGHVTARAPAQTLTDLTTWHATGTLSSDRIAGYGLTLTAVSADLSVDAGTAKASAMKATLESAKLTGSAELALASPWSYSGTLTLSGADLKAVQGLNPDFRPPFPVEGAADVTADLKGTLRPAHGGRVGVGQGVGPDTGPVQGRFAVLQVGFGRRPAQADRGEGGAVPGRRDRGGHVAGAGGGGRRRGPAARRRGPAGPGQESAGRSRAGYRQSVRHGDGDAAPGRPRRRPGGDG